MPLRTIIWNGLYSAQRSKRAEVRERIQSYYEQRRLGKKGVTVVDVRYIPIHLSRPVTDDLKLTGWHGESGAAMHGGHITACFRKSSGRHFKTVHIY